MADMELIEAFVMPASDVEIHRGESIGQGGFGTVYRGEHVTHGTVAVKMLISEGSLPKRLVSKLLTEAQRLKQTAEHPYIVNLVGVIMEPGNYSLILEYITFSSSANFVEDFEVDTALLVRVSSQVIDAMDYLHGHHPPILHLDLKADNVLIDKHLNAKICDFGLSKWKTATMKMSSVNMRQCTISHIAPEVLQDLNAGSTKLIDVYAFGVTLWEIFTAQQPYQDQPNEMIKLAVLGQQRPNLNALPTDCPAPIPDMITRCWHHIPQSRPTFAALKQELAPLLSSVEPAMLVAMKNIRTQVCAKYAVNEFEYSDTEYLDDLPVPGSSDESTGHVTPPTSTPQPAPAPTPIENDHNSQVHAPLSQQTLQMSPKMALPKPLKELTPFDVQVRKILRDPLALELLNSEERNKLICDENVRELFSDPHALMDYVNEDTELRLELYRSHSPFLANIHGPRRRAADYRGWTAGQEKTEQDIAALMRGAGTGNQYKTEEIQRRQETRSRRVETMNNSSYLKSQRGIADKLAKAVQDPRNLRDALNDSSTGTGGAEKFELVEKNVLEAATDSVLLQIVLSKNPRALDYLIREHPDLLMELLAKNTTNYRSQPGRKRLPVTHSQDVGRGRGMYMPIESRPGMADRRELRHTEPHQIRNVPISGKQKREVEAEKRRKADTERLDVENNKLMDDKKATKDISQKSEKDATDIELARQQMRKDKENKKEKQTDVDWKKQKDLEIKPIEVKEKQKSTSDSARILSTMQTMFNHIPSLNDELPSMLTMDELSKEAVAGVDTEPVPAPAPAPAPAPTGDATNTVRGGSPMVQDVDSFAVGNTTPTSMQGGLPPSPAPQTKKIPNEERVFILNPETKAKGKSSTRGMSAGASVDPMSISHKHGDGACTKIKIPSNKLNKLNIQVGNRQTMIINNSGDGDNYKRSTSRSGKKENIQLSKSTNQLNKDQLDGICTQIGADWRKLCRELGFKEGEIDQLRQDHFHEGTYEVTYQALQKWMQRNTTAATIKSMAEILHNIDRDDLARDLQ